MLLTEPGLTLSLLTEKKDGGFVALLYFDFGNP